jgi:hypothetical protein
MNKSKKRVTYRAQYNYNAGYIASRKVMVGRYKGDILVLYKASELGLDDSNGKYVVVNESKSVVGCGASSLKKGMDLLKYLQTTDDYQF